MVENLREICVSTIEIAHTKHTHHHMGLDWLASPSLPLFNGFLPTLSPHPFH